MDLASDVQLLISENKSVSCELQNQSKKREKLEQKCFSLQEQIKKLEFDVASLQMERGQVQNSCKIQEGENNDLKRATFALEKQVEELSRGLNSTNKQLMEKNNEI